MAGVLTLNGEVDFIKYAVGTVVTAGLEIVSINVPKSRSLKIFGFSAATSDNSAATVVTIKANGSSGGTVFTINFGTSSTIELIRPVTLEQGNYYIEAKQLSGASKSLVATVWGKWED